MKRGINSIMPIKFAINLDTVESIEFIFRQTNTYKIFKYPSDTAKRNTNIENVINLFWSEDDLWSFAPGKVGLDTKIYLKDTNNNPETKIVMIDLHETLFEKEYL